MTLRPATSNVVTAHMVEELGANRLKKTMADLGMEELSAIPQKVGLEQAAHLDEAGLKKFADSSEAKALLQLPGVRAELDRDCLADYLHLGYVPAPRSISATAS